MSRFINLNGFQKPNLGALAQRYVLELSLPPQVATYVTNLMDMLPPRFDPIHGTHVYPRYEARVMAYIIYVLKLLFGLDDVKECAISDAAIQINKQLAKIADGLPDSMAPLFVYTEWMEFVELRKVLVAHHNESFARRFGVPTRDERQVNDFLKKESMQREQEYNYNEMLITPAMQRMRENVSLIFETFLKQKFGESNSTASPTVDHIEFQPTVTPAHSYFKRILLRADQAKPNEMSVHIPGCMREDHTERQLEPFNNKTAQLYQFLEKHGCKLVVEELACQADYQSVGIFQTLVRPTIRYREYRANCEIKTQTWIDELRQREKRPNFVFRQPVANYGKQYQNIIKERSKHRETLEANNPFWKISPTPNYILKLNDNDVSLNSLASIQTFDEHNMEPLRVPLNMPRRLMTTESTGSKQVKVEPTHSQEANEFRQKSDLLLKISNFDCWLLNGHISNIREIDKLQLRSIFPCSFRWLLETCAATIGVEWDILYEQLLVLEVMFHHGIDWSNHSNYLRLKYNMSNKDLTLLTRNYRDLW